MLSVCHFYVPPILYGVSVFGCPMSDTVAAIKVADERLECVETRVPRGSANGTMCLERKFGGVLQAWLRLNHPDAAAKAEVGLQQMIQFADSKRFDCCPIVYSFTSVITAHARSKSRRDTEEKAPNLFNTLKASADEHGDDPMLQPNLLT